MRRAAVALAFAFGACSGPGGESSPPSAGTGDAGGTDPGDTTHVDAIDDDTTHDDAIDDDTTDDDTIDDDTTTPSTPDAAGDPDSSSDLGPLPSAADAPLRGPCPMATDWGGFELQVAEFAFLVGAVADGVVPVTVLEVVETSGDCRLLKRVNPFCDPPCAAGETCDHSGECIPFPKNQDLGPVTVEGLSVEGAAVVLAPQPPASTYSLTTLANPPYAPGDVLRLTAPGTAAGGAPDGGEIGPVELYGIGVAPLVLETTQWDVEEGEPLEIVWTPPPAGARSRVHVTINIDQHGNSPVVLDCDLPDTGAASIPSSLLDALLASGISGFPNGQATRRTADSHLALVDPPPGTPAGCLDLLVTSPVVPDVRVAGHTPCKQTLDCPSGQTCNVSIETCE